MLETCQSIDQVKSILKETPRTGGMLIFAAEQNAAKNRAALLECAPQVVHRRDLEGECLAGRNHYQSHSTRQPAEVYARNSVERFRAMEASLTALSHSPKAEDLIAILANPAVEQHQPDYGTVYSNLACLNQRKYWFTFGGFPAASRGLWKRVPWPF